MRPYVLHWLEHYLHPDIAGVLAPSWFTCVGLAGLVALILMLALARRTGVDSGAVASMVLWGYVAAVVAGIAMPMLVDGVEQLAATGRVRLHWAGMTSFWGYLAGAGAVALVCRRDGVPLARVADLAVAPLGAALVLARLGCFMAGCDHGVPSALPWAVQFPAGSPAWRDQLREGLITADRAAALPVHPTQLYEALLGAVFVAIAIAAGRRLRRDGDRFLLAAASYAIGRLAIEALRGDDGRGIHAGVSSGQIFCLLVLVAVAVRIVAMTRRRVAALAATAAALVLALAPSSAHAQPGLAAPVLPDELPPGSPPPPPPQPGWPPGPPPAFDPTERPMFSAGFLLGGATPLNRRGNQVETLGGGSLSLGYMPGWLGFWLDLDSLSNADATHTGVLAAVSVTRRPTRRLMLGARFGVGVTQVNFKDAAFQDVVGMAWRAEAIMEYAFVRHWALWVRPLSIDTLTAAELGGPITTYQVRIGVAYRFGSRRNARPPAPAVEQLPEPPAEAAPPPAEPPPPGPPPPGPPPLPPLAVGDAP